jgi:hypothetical protein
MYPDIARFGYDSGISGVGGVPSPMTTGVGASNPTAAYLASFGSPTGFGDMLQGPGVPGGVPGIGVAGANPLAGSGLGFNVPTAQLALGGLQTIGNLWQAWESNKLAKEQFKFSKDFANTNLANQIQSYNTTLEDRTRARTFTEGGTDADAQAYIDEHSLRRQ